MGVLRQIVGGITCGLSFALLIFVLNPIQVLSALIYPISPRTCRAVNRACAATIWGIWVLMGEVMQGIDIRFSGDDIKKGDDALVLPNHQSMTDVLLVLCFSWRGRRLGDTKWFVKDAIKWFPGVGWGMKFLDCIFVKRDWTKDKRNLERPFARYKRESIPLFLVSFLEGTRKTPGKLKQSQDFAESRDLPVLQHHLLPRTKGFVATMGQLGNNIDAVYDLTFGYPEEEAHTLWQAFQGKMRWAAIHVRRYEAKDLPTDEEELAEWAQVRFRERDELMAHFREHGEFPGRHYDAPLILGDWYRSAPRDPVMAPRSSESKVA